MTYELVLCAALSFLYQSLTNIINQDYFSQSKSCRFIMHWRGTKGKALLQLLDFAGRLCRLQMGLGMKVWAHGFALTYLIFSFIMPYICFNLSKSLEELSK